MTHPIQRRSRSRIGNAGAVKAVMTFVVRRLWHEQLSRADDYQIDHSMQHR
jgi:hypothetical protein